MKHKKYIFVVLLIFACQIFAQDDLQKEAKENARVATIENKLELLNVNIPGLSEKVNVNISNTSLLNFLRAVSQVHKMNINVTQELSNTKIINGFNDVTVQDLLVFLVKEYDLDIEFTGNILSIKKFKVPVEAPKEKEIQVSYDALTSSLSMDVKNDPLPKVFRKITEVSGKNLLFTPDLNTKNLNLFISDVPFDIAIEKLASSNAMELTKTKDGFYEFEGYAESGGSTIRRRRRGDFEYKVLDTINKIVAIDVVETPIAKIINAFADDLKLEVFTASPLENAGKVTVNAGSIAFDDLLTKMFESSITSNTVTSAPSASSNRGNDRNDSRRNSGNSNQNKAQSNTASKVFTFKKEGNVYYFGTEDQLSVKKIELIQFMHRSIVSLGDAVNSGSAVSSNFVTGGTNFFGGANTSTTNQNTSTNRSNYNRTNSSSSRNNSTETGSILEVFPATILEGLDVKVDTELNSFVVSGSGTRVERFKNFVKSIDKPIPLILIEVMILEVNRSATIETGVEFGIGSEATTTEGVAFPDGSMTLGAETINRVIGGFDGLGSLNLGNVVPNFYMDIKALESNGNVKILSTPKLSTLNGHKAYLSSGQTTYYAVTNQSFFGSQIPQTSEVVNYQPIDAELALEFKPFVSGDGQITLDIQVLQSSFSGERIAEDAPPDIASRKFSSIMRMRANDVAILGGIEQKVKNDSGSGVPVLSRIPILKWFFSKRVREDSKQKLNVIIKPTIFY